VQRHLSLYDQQRQLTEVRAAGIAPIGMNCQAQREPLRRLDRAFQAYFRRVKAGEKPGYPRHQGESRYDSLTWPFGNGATFKVSRLKLQGIGKLRFRRHRQLPNPGKIKQVTVKRSAGLWYVCFVVELVSTPPLPTAGERTGID